MVPAGLDPNFTLPAQFYTSNEIFEEELEKIFYSKWIYVACEADLPKPGDYITLKLGKRSFFLQRGQNGEVRGFYNVCRHRGHELLSGERGNRKGHLLSLPQLDLRSERKAIEGTRHGRRFSQREFRAQCY